VPNSTFWPDTLAPLDAASVETIVEAQAAVRHALGDLLAVNARSLGQSGVPVTTEVREGNAAHELITAASENHAALIVAGSHGRRGLRRAVLGSVSRGVVQHAHASVLIVPSVHAADAARVSQADAA
jgi:nucleotide-binding universal stress UspA family protein